MMKVLLDTNIVLDVLLARAPFLTDSKRIWEACEDGRLDGYILASSLTDIFYVARKLKGHAVARSAVEVCLDAFTVCAIDRKVLEQALQLSGNDFEDNVQIAAATLFSMDIIVTRNPSDFKESPVPAMMPSSVLS